MTNDLWVLQTKSNPKDYWTDVMMPVPLDEIERFVGNMLDGWRTAGRQHYYRAYCTTNDKLETKHWQALPDFPDFSHWDDYGKIAVMKDGTRWQLV